MSEDGVQVTLLGTGTSTGIPVIGCACATCRSDDPRDRRLRCSCLVEVNGLRILIDVGPDFRTQALRYGVDDVDAVLITHHHFDHVAGLDDLRPLLFRNRAAIPCFAVGNTVETLTDMVPYIFRDGSYPGVARLSLQKVEGPFSVSSRNGTQATVDITPIPAMHGTLPVLGFRIGSFAYLTDVSDVPFASRHLLEDLDLLVLDALREHPHPMHLSFSESVTLASEIRAQETWFIHMTHGVLHADVDADLPAGMSLGWDGRVSRLLRLRH